MVVRNWIFTLKLTKFKTNFIINMYLYEKFKMQTVYYGSLYYMPEYFEEL